jgi:hypothetical protein
MKITKMVMVGKMAEKDFVLDNVKVPLDPSDPKSKDVPLRFQKGEAVVPHSEDGALLRYLERFYGAHVYGSDSHKAAVAAHEAEMKAQAEAKAKAEKAAAEAAAKAKLEAATK